MCLDFYKFTTKVAPLKIQDVAAIILTLVLSGHEAHLFICASYYINKNAFSCLRTHFTPYHQQLYSEAEVQCACRL